MGSRSYRVIQGFGNHDLGQRLGGAVLGQLGTGQAAIHPHPQPGELLEPSNRTHGPALGGCEPSVSITSVYPRARLEMPGIRLSMASRSSAW